MRIVTLLACLLLIAASVQAQFISPAFHVEVGSHVNFMWQSIFAIKGHTFEAPKSWSHGTYIVLYAPGLDMTYTQTPASLRKANDAILVSESHRADLELKLGLPVKPLATVEFVPTSLKTFSWDGGRLVVGNQDIKELYGGGGATIEFPLAEALRVKMAASYQFINRNGYEGALGISWRSPKFLKFRLSTLAGVNMKHISYSQGESESYGAFIEMGLLF